MALQSIQLSYALHFTLIFAFTQDNFGIFPSGSMTMVVFLLKSKLMRHKAAITDFSFPHTYFRLTMALFGRVTISIVAHLLLRAPTLSTRLILSLIQPLSTHGLIMESASVSFKLLLNYAKNIYSTN